MMNIDNVHETQEEKSQNFPLNWIFYFQINGHAFVSGNKTLPNIKRNST